MVVDNNGRLIGRCIDWIAADHPRPTEDDLENAIQLEGETQIASIEAKMQRPLQPQQPNTSLHTNDEVLNPSDLKPMSWTKGQGKVNNHVDVTGGIQTFNQNFHTGNRDMHPHTGAQLFRNQNQNVAEQNHIQQSLATSSYNHAAVPSTPRMAPSTPVRNNHRTGSEIPMRLQTPVAQSSAPPQPSPTPPNNWVFGGVLKRIGKAQMEYNRNQPY